MIDQRKAYNERADLCSALQGLPDTELRQHSKCVSTFWEAELSRSRFPACEGAAALGCTRAKEATAQGAYCTALRGTSLALCPRGDTALTGRLADALDYGAVPLLVNATSVLPHLPFAGRVPW